MRRVLAPAALPCLLSLALLAAPAAATPAKPDSKRLLDGRRCLAQVEELAAVAAGPQVAYVIYEKQLRREYLDNPGPKHRERARRALLKLILLKTGATTAATAGCTEEPSALTPAEVQLLAPWYGLAEGGSAGTTELRRGFKEAGKGADMATRRLVIANSLALTGVIPTAEMIEELLLAIAAETQQQAVLEEILALAAYAQKSKDAFGPLRELLLAWKDCSFARRLVFNLPGEDLRYRLFHGLKGHKAKRAQDIRVWLKEGGYAPCS